MFAGVPGPASQLPRFSGPLPPGTRPRHRFGLRLWSHTSSDGRGSSTARSSQRGYGSKSASMLEVERMEATPERTIPRGRPFPCTFRRLSAPSRQGALVRVDVPDLQIAARLIVGQLVLDVVASRRRRPDLDDQGQGLRIGIETNPRRIIEKRLYRSGRNDRDVRDVVRVRRASQARVLDRAFGTARRSSCGVEQAPARDP